MTSDSVRPLVLVVEDDPDTRDMYAMYLELSGYGVLTASNATAAFEMALEHQPQMVVTDLRLAGEATGVDLCRRLRGEPRTMHIPTLLLTGSARQQDTGVDYGCVKVRIKPYLPDALLNDIKEALAHLDGQRISR